MAFLTLFVMALRVFRFMTFIKAPRAYLVLQRRSSLHAEQVMCQGLRYRGPL
jgi:hypothetical protein